MVLLRREAMGASLKTFGDEIPAQVRVGVGRGEKSLGGDRTEHGL